MKYVLILFLLISCESEVNKIKQPPRSSSNVQQSKELEPPMMSDSIVRLYHSMGLYRMEDSRIFIDLRYATENNFIGMVLYDTLNQLYLQKDVIQRLMRCQDYLDSLHYGIRLKIFDGVRPLEVQRKMWTSMDTIPPIERGKFVSNPKFGSVHNFGAAVDLTICDSLGNDLDMGAGYDDFRTIAFPVKEAYFLKTGALSKKQYENRKLLRSTMKLQGFSSIPSEWWHFNAYPRREAQDRFEMLINESGRHRKWNMQ
ncbi:M15 family metallopeptidase [Crocinitomicaceae bacterium]|nr:M15 family metallopeptidase [Crocinitomicaceae bacterium]